LIKLGCGAFYQVQGTLEIFAVSSLQVGKRKEGIVHAAVDPEVKVPCFSMGIS